MNLFMLQLIDFGTEIIKLESVLEIIVVHRNHCNIHNLTRSGLVEYFQISKLRKSIFARNNEGKEAQTENKSRLPKYLVRSFTCDLYPHGLSKNSVTELVSETPPKKESECSIFLVQIILLPHDSNKKNQLKSFEFI